MPSVYNSTCSLVSNQIQSCGPLGSAQVVASILAEINATPILTYQQAETLVERIASALNEIDYAHEEKDDRHRCTFDVFPPDQYDGINKTFRGFSDLATHYRAGNDIPPQQDPIESLPDSQDTFPIDVKLAELIRETAETDEDRALAAQIDAIVADQINTNSTKAPNPVATIPDPVDPLDTADPAIQQVLWAKQGDGKEFCFENIQQLKKNSRPYQEPRI